jgi:hypothetical protein
VTAHQPVRAGDTIVDALGGRNRVLAAQPRRMLLEDSTGFRFILARQRLTGDWTHEPQKRSQPYTKGREHRSRPPRQSRRQIGVS